MELSAGQHEEVLHLESGEAAGAEAVMTEAHPGTGTYPPVHLDEQLVPGPNGPITQREQREATTYVVATNKSSPALTPPRVYPRP